MERHRHHHDGRTEAGLKGRLILSIVLTTAIFFAEAVGGYLTNSLSLASDALHVFMDAFSLSLSLLAIRIAEMPPTERRTYGLHRVEVFVSFVNSVMLVLITAFILYKAYGRLLDPQRVESAGVLWVAAVGLVVNAAVAYYLRGHAAEDMNVRSAFLHVLGDALASIGVIIGSVVMYYTGWYAADPIISAAIGVAILYGAYGILRDSSHILLEGVPKGIDLGAVAADMTSVKGVDGIHSLHIWSICHNVYALSAHVDIVPVERWRMGEIFREMNERLAERYGISYTTLQAECIGCNPSDMLRAIAHRAQNHLH